MNTKRFTSGLFAMIFLLAAFVVNGQNGGIIVDTCTCLRIESGTKVDITNGDLVIKSSSDGDASLIDFGSSGAPAVTFSGSSSGESKVQRYLVQGEWHLISPPISDAVSGMFLNDYLQYYTESNSTWTDIIPTNISLSSMQGYSLWSVESVPTTEVFEGTVNTGTYNFSYTYSGTSYGWNLVGNPYPSVLDWDEVSIPSNLGATIYLFDPTIGTNGDYVYYLSTDNNSTTTQYIPSGQGFFVRATGSGTLTFNNDDRTHGGQDFYKNTNTNDPSLLLHVTGNGITTQTTIRFNENATQGFDNLYDAYRLFYYIDEVPKICTKIGDETIITNTFPSIEGNEKVPLWFYTGTPGNYAISAAAIENFSDDQPIFIEDKKENLFQNLRKYPEYYFAAEEGDDPARFVIYFTNPNGIDDEFSNTGGINIFAFGKTVCVIMDAGVSREATCEIYNITGQKLLTRHICGGRNEFAFPFNPGNYIVRVIGDNIMATDKIFIR